MIDSVYQFQTGNEAVLQNVIYKCKFSQGKSFGGCRRWLKNINLCTDDFFHLSNINFKIDGYKWRWGHLRQNFIINGTRPACLKE